MRISQAAAALVGRSERVRFSGTVAAEWEGALPIEHRQSPMVPRLSAKHGVWRCFEVFNPEL